MQESPSKRSLGSYGSSRNLRRDDAQSHGSSGRDFAERRKASHKSLASYQSLSATSVQKKEEEERKLKEKEKELVKMQQNQAKEEEKMEQAKAETFK